MRNKVKNTRSVGMSRKRIPPKVEAEVLAVCRRRCCICFGLNRDTDIKFGQIAHLDHNPSNNDLDNLAFLCLQHHDQYDTQTSQSKGLKKREVRIYRTELHGVIDKAWKKPVELAGVQVRSPNDISGSYIRETEFESAEIKVKMLSDNRVHIIGLAIWGIAMEYGPNIGEIDFEAQVEGNRIVFSDICSSSGKEYRLDLSFQNGKLIADEHYVPGYFGKNVSFQGEYERVD